jgi:hypothetical protein
MAKVCLERFFKKVEKKYNLKDMFNIWMYFCLRDLDYKKSRIRNMTKDQKSKIIMKNILRDECDYDDVIGLPFYTPAGMVDFIHKCSALNSTPLHDLSLSYYEKLYHIYQEIDEMFDDYCEDYGLVSYNEVRSSRLRLICPKKIDNYKYNRDDNSLREIFNSYHNTFDKFKKKRV